MTIQTSVQLQRRVHKDTLSSIERKMADRDLFISLVSRLSTHEPTVSDAAVVTEWREALDGNPDRLLGLLKFAFEESTTPGFHFRGAWHLLVG